jgi:pimeloyl-ACP methyl ester carboxylesterase
MEMRKLERNPNRIVRYMSGERYAEIGDDAATQRLAARLVDSELRCARRPAGIENDWFNAVGKPWLTPNSVRCPTLILHDRADPLVPFAHAQWAMRCIPTAKLIDLHTGGHLIWVGKDAGRMRRERSAFVRRHFEA